ncbi:MAG: PqqD family protein [Ignavibacteria bacterium]|nr:PqqD family protein [Ignavibacteria bacterium]
MKLYKKKIQHNLLELTPVRGKDFFQDKGRVTIYFPKFKNSFMQSLIPRNKPKDINIHLDELGSEVWLAIDGNKNVSFIIKELDSKIGENIQPSQDRISKFITKLYHHKFIYFKEFRKEKKK